MHFDPLAVQQCTLLSIKTGGCSEDCKYCPQSSSYSTVVKAQKMLDTGEVLEAARAAKAAGSTRFCMGAAWRDLAGRKSNFKKIVGFVKEIRYSNRVFFLGCTFFCVILSAGVWGMGWRRGIEGEDGLPRQTSLSLYHLPQLHSLSIQFPRHSLTSFLLTLLSRFSLPTKLDTQSLPTIFQHPINTTNETTKNNRAMDMEVCCTLGMLNDEQAGQLKDAGLTAYNHNLDTSREYYPKIITTRSYDERLETISKVREAGISVCSGGIIGLGETDTDRVGMLHTLSTMPAHPESVPVNALLAVEGTPLEKQEPVKVWDMVRMIATARIVMPKTMIRLSAGRVRFTEPEQALCFMAGANSIFTGDKLLTTPNNKFNADQQMFDTLGKSLLFYFSALRFLLW